MAENMQKIKLLKLYELLRKETDIRYPVLNYAEGSMRWGFPAMSVH